MGGPITPANVRALALSQAKELYPEADVLDHITVADWLLAKPDVRQAGEDSGLVLRESAAVDIGPRLDHVDYAKTFRWTDSQDGEVEVQGLDSPDMDGDIAWISTRRNGEARMGYMNRVQAERVIQTLQRAMAKTHRSLRG